MRFTNAITTLVAQTVDEFVRFNISTENGMVQTIGPHSALANIMSELLQSNQEVNILSYNYDPGQ